MCAQMHLCVNVATPAAKGRLPFEESAELKPTDDTYKVMTVGVDNAGV